MTDHTTHFDDCGCKSKALEAERDALRSELAEDEALRARLADILTRTAVALKGEPEPLSSHSWHDLPERAGLIVENERRLIAEAKALRLRVAALEAVLRSFGSHMKSVVDALAGDTTALRAMLVPAFNAGFNTRDNGEGMNGYEDGDDYADRILGASKEGGE